MKKLISGGIAVVLMVTFMLPVVVAADTDWADVPQPIEHPAAYSKTPFAIMGTGIQLMGYLAGDFAPILEGAGIDVPIDLNDLQTPALRIGAWVGGPVAWLTDMMGWSIVMLGDLVQATGGVIDGAGFNLPIDMGDVATLFYVVAARMLDEWGMLVDLLGDLGPRLG